MNRKYLILSTLVIGLFVSPQIAKADICDAPTMAASSASPIEIKILDTDIGTAAYDRLEAYGNGGHDALGRAIGAAHNWFENCTYPGIGLGIGSGGNGFRKNFNIAIWMDGVSAATARQAIYALISAPTNPVTTNGDCAISCDAPSEAINVNSNITETSVAPIEAPAVSDSPLVIASVANPFLTNAVPKQITTPKRKLVVSKKKVTKKVGKGHARVS